MPCLLGFMVQIQNVPEWKVSLINYIIAFTAITADFAKLNGNNLNEP